MILDAAPKVKLVTTKRATLSDCGSYRYTLSRDWERPYAYGRCVFVMLNPSTADATEDDNTIRRCIGYAYDWGYAALDVVNVYAYRTTYPKELRRAADPVGPMNDHYIAVTAAAAHRIVLAWGANVDLWPTRERPNRVLDLVRVSKAAQVELGILGKTTAGCPLHPLRLPKTQSFYALSPERGVPL